jgi:FKBP-type peptidyl-prolyl cis-trans isomerase SlyD
MVVEKDKIVSIEYTVRDENGHVLDSNEGFSPLVFQHGSDTLVVGLEKAIEGMTCGDTKEMVISPEDAYGFVDKKRIIRVSKSLYKENSSLNEGDRLPLPDGGEGIIVGKNSRSFTIDTNHPLAGQTLYCWVKIVDIKIANAIEKQAFALPISNYCSGETCCC